MPTPIKKCLLMRAMLPDRFPQAYDKLVEKLSHAAGNGGARLHACTCRPFRCGQNNPAVAKWLLAHNQGEGIPQPTYKQVEALTDRIAWETEEVRNEYLRLQNVPVDKM